MKITILTENSTSHSHSRLYSSEWGLSIYIQTKNTNILFDTGHSDIYWKNAEKMGIDLNDTDFVILSHRHWDHVEGILHHRFKKKKKIILHPDFLKKATKNITTMIQKDFEVIESSTPLRFSEENYFLGEIPRKMSYEKGTYKNHQMLEDTALAIKSENGVILIAGCSHSGISNICEYAKQVTNQNLFAVVGGFHLFENDPEAIHGTIKYFKKEKPEYLYPMHCVDFPTMVKFHNEFKVKKLGAGDEIILEK